MGLFPNGNGEKALILITQHMHDCELRGVEITRRLNEQDVTHTRMHEQNINKHDLFRKDIEGRLNKLMFLLVSVLTTAIGALVFEIVKETHK